MWLKLKIVVFGPPGVQVPDQWQWHYTGSEVPRSQEFRYLGTVYHATDGVSGAISILASAAQRAISGHDIKVSTYVISWRSQ